MAKIAILRIMSDGAWLLVLLNSLIVVRDARQLALSSAGSGVDWACHEDAPSIVPPRNVDRVPGRQLVAAQVHPVDAYSGDCSTVAIKAEPFDRGGSAGSSRQGSPRRNGVAWSAVAATPAMAWQLRCVDTD